MLLIQIIRIQIPCIPLGGQCLVIACVRGAIPHPSHHVHHVQRHLRTLQLTACSPESADAAIHRAKGPIELRSGTHVQQPALVSVSVVSPSSSTGWGSGLPRPEGHPPTPQRVRSPGIFPVRVREFQGKRWGVGGPARQDYVLSLSVSLFFFYRGMGKEDPLPATRPTPTDVVRWSWSPPAPLLGGRSSNLIAEDRHVSQTNSCTQNT